MVKGTVNNYFFPYFLRDVSFLYDIALGKEDERERSLAGFFSERGDKQTQNNASPITPAVSEEI